MKIAEIKIGFINKPFVFPMLEQLLYLVTIKKKKKIFKKSRYRIVVSCVDNFKCKNILIIILTIFQLKFNLRSIRILKAICYFLKDFFRHSNFSWFLEREKNNFKIKKYTLIKLQKDSIPSDHMDKLTLL